MGQNQNLTAQDRQKLRGLKLKSAPTVTVSEGDLVEVTAFVIGLPNRPKASGPEAVNCRLTGRDSNDFHIPLARDPGDTEFEGIVVEIIPQQRNSQWTIRKLRRIAREGRPVLVRGQLFYDNEHVVNDDPDELAPGDPKRFSLWEIHPVTAFFVCLRAGCNPRDEAQWERLENVGE